MNPSSIVPPVTTAKNADLQGNRGISGDGGNRTRATFPSSPRRPDSKIPLYNHRCRGCDFALVATLIGPVCPGCGSTEITVTRLP